MSTFHHELLAVKDEWSFDIMFQPNHHTEHAPHPGFKPGVSRPTGNTHPLELVRLTDTQ